jgi:hypothetical protein
MLTGILDGHPPHKPDGKHPTEENEHAVEDRFDDN